MGSSFSSLAFTKKAQVFRCFAFLPWSCCPRSNWSRPAWCCSQVFNRASPNLHDSPVAPSYWRVGSCCEISTIRLQKGICSYWSYSFGAKDLQASHSRGIARWVSDFLMNRQQRVKLSRDCSSEWGHVPADVPQGTKLGPCLFLLMINNLKVSDMVHL